ncbi:MAG: helix-hairpin-helix domain-containing protein, partial [Lachnospiraceae bacterium]|nr:helix-hairpin-helix domain-containing protein [Lachnospiraceae bacterium]
EYISGISKPVAKNIVEYREANGKFKERKELLKVPKLGPKAYEQCAGFLRINDGTNPLDATSVHPESYEAVKNLLKKLDMTMDDIKQLQKQAKDSSKQVSKPAGENKKNRRPEKRMRIDTSTAMGKALAAAMGNVKLEEEPAKTKETVKQTDSKTPSLARKIGDTKKMAEQLGIGEITLMDILKELEKPSRDPREDMPKPILRSDVLDMKDLKSGMILKGTVRNVIDFGVFVDIGVHQDGLVHISQITDRYIKHPLEAVSVGDIVDVKVLDVDIAKKRISLTMKV